MPPMLRVLIAVSLCTGCGYLGLEGVDETRDAGILDMRADDIGNDGASNDDTSDIASDVALTDTSPGDISDTGDMLDGTSPDAADTPDGGSCPNPLRIKLEYLGTNAALLAFEGDPVRQVRWGTSATMPTEPLNEWITGSATGRGTTSPASSLRLRGIEEGLYIAAYQGDPNCSDVLFIEPAPLFQIETVSPLDMQVLVSPAAVPDSITPPILLFLHDRDDAAPEGSTDVTNFESTPGLATLLERPDIFTPAGALPFVLVAPRCNRTSGVCNSWDLDRAQFQMIVGAGRSAGGDPARVYVTGIGGGGAGAYRVMQRLDEVTRAAVPIAASFYDSITSEFRAVCSTIPVWAIHSTLDTIADPALAVRYTEALRDCGSTAYWHTGSFMDPPDHHAGYVEAYTGALAATPTPHETVFDWMAAQ